GGGVAGGGRRPLHAPAGDDLGEQPEGAAVGVVGDHHVVAGAEQGAQQAVLRRQPGRERETATAALQGGEVLLQGGPGGVGAAAVLVAAAQAADTVLLVGGDLVDRRDVRARQGVGGVARVDRERLEVLTDVPVAHGPEGS